MNNNILEYKGYHTKIEFDTETFILYGKIEGINDLIDFESDNAKTIETEFHNAVDDYLEFCKEVGKEPEKEYKGLFNVRINPELHKKLAIRAYVNGDSLNSTVEKAIAAYLSETTESNIQLEKSIKILANLLETRGVSTQNGLSVEVGSKIVPFTKPSHINMIYK